MDLDKQTDRDMKIMKAFKLSNYVIKYPNLYSLVLKRKAVDFMFEHPHITGITFMFTSDGSDIVDDKHTVIICGME